MTNYVLKTIQQKKGYDVLLFDIGFAPQWMIHWRLQKALAWLRNDVEDMPGGFGSIYGGFKIRELIADEESSRSLEKLKNLVFPEIPAQEPQAAAESVDEEVEFMQPSAKRIRIPRPPPAPPPVAAEPWSKPEPTMASASSSRSSSAGGSLSESDM